MSKLNVRLTYRVVSKTKFGAQSVINSITSSAVSKPRLSKQLKPSNVAIIMPPNSIVQDMAGALKLCGEQGDKKSLYVFWQNLVSLSDATAYHARPLPPKPKSKKVVAQTRPLLQPPEVMRTWAVRWAVVVVVIAGKGKRMKARSKCLG